MIDQSNSFTTDWATAGTSLFDFSENGTGSEGLYPGDQSEEGLDALLPNAQLVPARCPPETPVCAFFGLSNSYAPSQQPSATVSKQDLGGDGDGNSFSVERCLPEQTLQAFQAGIVIKDDLNNDNALTGADGVQNVRANNS